MSVDDAIREHEEQATIFASQAAQADAADGRDPSALAGVHALAALRLELRESRRSTSRELEAIYGALDGIRLALVDLLKRGAS